jgi:hypothetical protein
MKAVVRKYFLLAYVLQSGFFCSCVCAEENGLVGYWSFDQAKGNIAYDGSGKNNSGTVNGALRVKGKIGEALYFNGKYSWVRVPKSELLKVRNNQISILVWFRPDKPTGQVQHLVTKWGNYYLRFSPENKLTFAVFNDKGEERGIVVNYDFKEGTWYFLAATYDGKSSAIYIDGALEGFESQGLTLNTENVYDLHLGSASWGTAELLNGRLDETKIYDRALTEEEILNEGGKDVKTKRIASLNTDTLALLKKTRKLLNWEPEKYTATYQMDLASLRSRIEKINKAISQEQSLTVKQATVLFKQSGALFTESDDLVYKLRLDILFDGN